MYHSVCSISYNNSNNECSFSWVGIGSGQGHCFPFKSLEEAVRRCTKEATRNGESTGVHQNKGRSGEKEEEEG